MKNVFIKSFVSIILAISLAVTATSCAVNGIIEAASGNKGNPVDNVDRLVNSKDTDPESTEPETETETEPETEPETERTTVQNEENEED